MAEELSNVELKLHFTDNPEDCTCRAHIPDDAPQMLRENVLYLTITPSTPTDAFRIRTEKEFEQFLDKLKHGRLSLMSECRLILANTHTATIKDGWLIVDRSVLEFVHVRSSAVMAYIASAGEEPYWVLKAASES